MGAGEYRYKRFVTQFNLTSIILEGDAITPVNLVLQGLTYRFEYTSGDFSAGYFVIKKPKIEVGVMLGFKFLYTKIGGSGSLVNIVDFDLERSYTWIDPIIVTRVKYMPHKRIEIMAYGDSDFGLMGDDLNYQFIGLATYQVSPWFLVSGGYRLWGLHIDGTDDKIYDGLVKGLF